MFFLLITADKCACVTRVDHFLSTRGNDRPTKITYGMNAMYDTLSRVDYPLPEKSSAQIGIGICFEVKRTTRKTNPARPARAAAPRIQLLPLRVRGTPAALFCPWSRSG